MNPLAWWLARRAAKRQAAALEALKMQWIEAIAAAKAVGCEVEQNRDPRNGALLTVVHDVDPECRPALEALGFRRLHAEAEVWMHMGPPTRNVARPAEMPMPGRPSRASRGRSGA